MSYFQPHGQPRPCRYCHYSVRQEPDTGSALCGHGGTLMRRSQAAQGCAFWERQPGADDDIEPQ